MAYYLSYVVTALFCCIAIVFFRRKVTTGAMKENRAKNIYSLISVVMGLCGGTLVFHSFVWFFGLFDIKTHFGHGEILIAVILYNFMLSLVLLVIGRSVIGWSKVSW